MNPTDQSFFSQNNPGTMNMVESACTGIAVWCKCPLFGKIHDI